MIGSPDTSHACPCQAIWKAFQLSRSSFIKVELSRNIEASRLSTHHCQIMLQLFRLCLQDCLMECLQSSRLKIGMCFDFKRNVQLPHARISVTSDDLHKKWDPSWDTRFKYAVYPLLSMLAANFFCGLNLLVQRQIASRSLHICLLQ